MVVRKVIIRRGAGGVTCTFGDSLHHRFSLPGGTQAPATVGWILVPRGLSGGEATIPRGELSFC